MQTVLKACAAALIQSNLKQGRMGQLYVLAEVRFYSLYYICNRESLTYNPMADFDLGTVNHTRSVIDLNCSCVNDLVEWLYTTTVYIKVYTVQYSTVPYILYSVQYMYVLYVYTSGYSTCSTVWVLSLCALYPEWGVNDFQQPSSFCTYCTVHVQDIVLYIVTLLSKKSASERYSENLTERWTMVRKIVE